MGLVLAAPRGAGAHRLDEYLQATRIAVSPDHIQVEIDLTPGVAVAPSVLASIDTDRDDRISTAEADAYAAAVVQEIVLVQDGRPQRLKLEGHQFPPAAELKTGMGTIRLEASAQASDGRGQHRLSLRNDHRPDVAVYLVNALAPTTPQITIEAQHRDPEQRGIQLDYSVASDRIRSAVVALGMLTLLGAALFARRGGS